MEQTKSMSETPDEYRGLHRILMGFAIFFFIYMVIEAIILIPVLFIRYGWH